MTVPRGKHSWTSDDSPETLLGRIADEADAWGGTFEGDVLRIPVTAGLRYGQVALRVLVESADDGSHVTYAVEENVYRVQRSSVLILVMAALGALTCVFGPFFAVLRPLVPIGFMLSLAAWLFIVGALRNSGPEEFFATVVGAPVEES